MALIKQRFLNKIVPLKKRHCPICDKSFFTFLPLPAQYTRNWIKHDFPYRANDFETLNVNEFSCPYCGSTDRDRLFSLYLSSLPLIKTSILDIAPSTSLSNWIKKNLKGTYVTADLYMSTVDLKIDVQDMRPISNNEFDHVICSHVLEHVSDDQKALTEIFRILKPSGTALLMVPIIPNLSNIIEDPTEVDVNNRWRRFGQDDHVRLYSKEGWLSRIRNAGFKVSEILSQDLVQDPQSFGIKLNSVLYIASKP